MDCLEGRAQALHGATPGLKDWNALVDAYNAITGPRRPRGRPLAATDEHVREVRALRKDGKSLRQIVALTGVSLRTAHTITSKDAGTDRVSVKQQKFAKIVRERAEVERDRMWLAGMQRMGRIRDGLPKRVTALAKRSEELRKRAGVSRAR